MTPKAAEDSDRIPFRDAGPVEWGKYLIIIIEPVEIYGGSDPQFNDLPQVERRNLANYIHKKFAEVLAEKFTVNIPAGNAPALRLKLTLTGADTTPQFVGNLTKFDLAGGPYNIVQSVRGGRGLMSGFVNYAVEENDVSTNELLLANVAEQYPNAINEGATSGSMSAAETVVDKGTEHLLEKLR